MEYALKTNNKKLLSIIIIAIISLLFYSNVFGGDLGYLGVLHEKTFKVKDGQRLELYAAMGDVKIDTWDKEELYVKVLGTNKVERKFDFTFEETSYGVRIEARKEGSDGWFNFSWFGGGNDLRFEIQVPKNFEVDAKTSGGDMWIRELAGRVNLKTSGGDISLLDYKGDADLNTSGGDIEIENSGGNISVSTSGGDIIMKSANGRIDAGTSGGDVTLDYEGNNDGVELHTSGGDIRVYLPSDFKADVYCKTSGGDVDVYFDKQRSEKVKSNRYEGTFNGGGNRLKCTTSGGDIVVKER